MTSPTALVASEEHQLALLLSGRCRRCAERIPGGTALRGRPCPRCDEPTLPSEADRAVLHALQSSRSAVRLGVAVVLVTVGALAASLLPLANSVLLALALVWVRLTVVRPALRLLTPRRRLVSRWTLRLVTACSLAACVVLLESLTLLSVVGAPFKAVVSALEVGLAGALSRRYLAWQAEREDRGESVAVWEVGLLGVWGLLLLTLVALSVAAILWILKVTGLLGRWMPGLVW